MAALFLISLINKTIGVKLTRSDNASQGCFITVPSIRRPIKFRPIKISNSFFPQRGRFFVLGEVFVRKKVWLKNFCVTEISFQKDHYGVESVFKQSMVFFDSNFIHSETPPEASEWHVHLDHMLYALIIPRPYILYASIIYCTLRSYTDKTSIMYCTYGEEAERSNKLLQDHHIPTIRITVHADPTSLKHIIMIL